MGEDDDRTLAGLMGPEPPFTPLPAVQRIGNRYEILGLLGTGGMGSVFRVRDLELDEVVALKRLRPELLSAPGILARFRQEVKLARRVSHPNVVRTFDLGEDGAERYLTMEYVEGVSLARVIESGTLSLRRAVEIAIEICHGIGAAHAVGVLHRDLKPENVLVESPKGGDPDASSGRVVITDFGIARLATEGSISRTVGVVGTPAYMAPEQIVGTELDARADLYALGAILYEMLTGRRAWKAADPFATAFARLSNPPPDPRVANPRVPAQLAAIVLRTMARDPAERFASAADLAAALLAAATDVSATTSLPVAQPPPILPGTLFGATLPGAASGGTTLVVLPFRNVGSEGDEYVAEALTDEVRDALSTTRGLRVRTGGQRSADGDVRAAGEALGVKVVVDGSVRRVGDRLRISVRLVHVPDGYQLSAHRYDCGAGEALVTSDGIVRDIAEALAAQTGAAATGQVADSYAMDLYLRARHELKRDWNTGPHGALALLRQAVGRAPEHPDILGMYALACARCTFFGGENAAALAAEARTASEQAVLLAAQATESWTALATVCWNESDMAGAGRALRRAVALSPSNARAQEMLGMLLLEAGRPDEAVVRLQAAQSIEPGSITTRSEILRAQALLGRWAQVDRMLAAQLPASDTERFGRMMATARLALWRPGEPVLEELPELGEASPSTRMAVVFVQMVHDIRRAGRMDPYQRQLLLELEPPSPSLRLRLVNLQMLAELFGFAGEHDLAVQRVTAAVDAGLEDLTWMDRCPCLSGARSDERWPALHARVKARADLVLAAIDGAS